MTALELQEILARVHLKDKMRIFARLHFVDGLSLSESARRAGVQRQNAHVVAKRVRALSASTLEDEGWVADPEDAPEDYVPPVDTLTPAPEPMPALDATGWAD